MHPEEFSIDATLKKKLMEKSAYFQCIWSEQSQFKDNQEKKLDLKSMTKDDFLFFAKMLGEERSLTLQEAVDLLSMADYFQASDLKKQCCLAIREFLESAFLFFSSSSYADEKNIEEMNTFILIYENFKDIPEISEMIRERILHLPGDTLLGILRSNNKTCLDILNSLPIVELDFYGIGIHDQDFASIKQLTHLEKLDLSLCRGFTDQCFESLPSTIKELKLNYVNSGQITFYGLADNLKYLNQLERIHLYKSNISQKIMSTIIEKLPSSAKVIMDPFE